MLDLARLILACELRKNDCFGLVGEGIFSYCSSFARIFHFLLCLLSNYLLLALHVRMQALNWSNRPSFLSDVFFIFGLSMKTANLHKTVIACITCRSFDLKKRCRVLLLRHVFRMSKFTMNLIASSHNVIGVLHSFLILDAAPCCPDLRPWLERRITSLDPGHATGSAHSLVFAPALSLQDALAGLFAGPGPELRVSLRSPYVALALA